MKHGTRDSAYPLPPKLFDARCRSCWLMAAIMVLVVASFASLDLPWAQLAERSALAKMGRFMAELLQPAWGTDFVLQVASAALETLAMSALGTLLAVLLGLTLALPASQRGKHRLFWRTCAGLLLNGLRSTPELVWGAMLLIAVGLGPFAGTLALALHTSGVLGRLFAQALENAPPESAFVLRLRGVGALRVFAYATLPQILPQLISYSLYRWENNIRAAAVLGIVGAGGLGQLLAFHMGLFQMRETSTVLLAMLLLVAGVDALSYLLRLRLSR